jgi:hypothetical protein
MAKTLEDLTVDELLAYAKSAQPAAELVSAMAKDPALREAWQGLVKKARPDLSIPEYDAKQSVRAEIATEREERQKLERAMMERDARDNVKERRASIKAKYKLSDADVEGVEKLMVDDKEVNWTHDAAARVYLASRQSATPTPATFAPPTYDMPEKDIWGKGLGNKAALDKIAMGQAFEAWNDIASGKVPGLGAGKAN